MSSCWKGWQVEVMCGQGEKRVYDGRKEGLVRTENQRVQDPPVFFEGTNVQSGKAFWDKEVGETGIPVSPRDLVAVWLPW